MVYVVTYELRRPGKDYANLYTLLRQFTHCHNSTSCWFIDSTQTAEQIRDGATHHIDTNDMFFVAPLHRSWAAWNTTCAAWLNSAGRNW
jgi:hypothetical protein